MKEIGSSSLRDVTAQNQILQLPGPTSSALTEYILSMLQFFLLKQHQVIRYTRYKENIKILKASKILKTFLFVIAVMLLHSRRKSIYELGQEVNVSLGLIAFQFNFSHNF